jgi:hypothetical protein
MPKQVPLGEGEVPRLSTEGEDQALEKSQLEKSQLEKSRQIQSRRVQLIQSHRWQVLGELEFWLEKKFWSEMKLWSENEKKLWSEKHFQEKKLLSESPETAWVRRNGDLVNSLSISG